MSFELPASSGSTPPHRRSLRLHNVQRHYDLKVDIPEFEGPMNSLGESLNTKDVPEHKGKLVAIKLREHASLRWEHVKKQRERERKGRVVTWEGKYEQGSQEGVLP